MYLKSLVVATVGMLVLTSISVHAQQKMFNTQLFKINLLPLTLRSYQISYETTVSNRWSFAINANVRPANGIPFQSDIEGYYTDNDIRVSGLRLSQYSITPEFRYYFIDASALRGFYLGTYFQYANFGVEMQIDYVGRGNGVNPSEFDLQGPIHAYTVGASFGRQWRFGNAFYLDWTIIGIGFGLNNGHINGSNINDRPLDDYEQQVFINKPNEFNIPFAEVHVKTTENTIDVYTSKFWPSIRSALSIGYRF